MFVVHARDPVAPFTHQEELGCARIMGNSIRIWNRYYDLTLEHNELQAALRAFAKRSATGGAAVEVAAAAATTEAALKEDVAWHARAIATTPTARLVPATAGGSGYGDLEKSAREAAAAAAAAAEAELAAANIQRASDAAAEEAAAVKHAAARWAAATANGKAAAAASTRVKSEHVRVKSEYAHVEREQDGDGGCEAALKAAEKSAAAAAAAEAAAAVVVISDSDSDEGFFPASRGRAHIIDLTEEEEEADSEPETFTAPSSPVAVKPQPVQQWRTTPTPTHVPRRCVFIDDMAGHAGGGKTGGGDDGWYDHQLGGPNYDTSGDEAGSDEAEEAAEMMDLGEYRPSIVVTPGRGGDAYDGMETEEEEEEAEEEAATPGGGNMEPPETDSEDSEACERRKGKQPMTDVPSSCTALVASPLPVGATAAAGGGMSYTPPTRAEAIGFQPLVPFLTSDEVDTKTIRELRHYVSAMYGYKVKSGKVEWLKRAAMGAINCRRWKRTAPFQGFR